MGLLDTNGDSSAYIRYSNGTISVGAGSTEQINVAGGGVTVPKSLTVQGDFNASAGMAKTYEYFSYRTLQGTTPVMSATQFTVSGTAAAGNGLTFYFTKQPLRGSGSILGLTLFTEDGTVKGGAITGSVFINGTLITSLAMNTGSICSTTYAKDLLTFNGSSLMTVQLTASSGFLSDIPLSCSWGALVEVEF